MTINAILDRLERPTKAGPGKWRARCPAHDDRSPSLAIRQLDDGRILIHCFAGCAPAEILQAIDLGFADLYPSAAAFHLPQARKPWNAHDVLYALAFEVQVAWNCASVLAQGGALDETDRARLLLCASRLQRGLEVIHG